jgi:hypothetical protein
MIILDLIFENLSFFGLKILKLNSLMPTGSGVEKIGTGSKFWIRDVYPGSAKLFK